MFRPTWLDVLIGCRMNIDSTVSRLTDTSRPYPSGAERDTTANWQEEPLGNDLMNNFKASYENFSLTLQ